MLPYRCTQRWQEKRMTGHFWKLVAFKLGHLERAAFSRRMGARVRGTTLIFSRKRE